MERSDRWSAVRRIRGLVGRAFGASERARRRGTFGLEALEGRQLFEGSFANAIPITLNGAGQGSSAGAINPAQPTTDNDYFSFVMPGAFGTTGFVSVLADTRNEGVNGSPLDTRVSIFAETDLVNPIVGGTGGSAADVTGVGNGTLTSGIARDGWGGFIGRAGVRYFVIVSSDNSNGSPVAGTYTLRVSAAHTLVDVDVPTGIAFEHGTPPPDFSVQPPDLPGAIVGSITRLEQDVVFKYVVPDNDAFNSLVSVNAQVTQNNLAIRLDSRVDIYRQSADTGKITRVTFDSDAGRFNDAFTAFRANKGETYWIRIRSDEIRPNVATTPTGTGSFFLVLDGRAEDLANPMNPVSRRGSTPGDAFIGFDPPTQPPTPNVPVPVFQTSMIRFVSQGSGTAIITGIGVGLNPVNDPALSLYDSGGQLLAFNDNFSGLNAQIEAEILGGREYFIILDGFATPNGSQYGVFVESNHTFSATTGIDDHETNPNPNQSGFSEARRILFENATPIRWGDPFLTRDGDGNLVRDVGYRTTGQATGRIQGAQDNDLFQFVPPVDMLGFFGGDNDDLGTSLFAGGRFELGDPSVTYPTQSRGLSNYDAGDWWYTGQQGPTGNGAQLFGFNPNTAASGRAEIYAMVDWDSNPAANPANGTTDHFLIVGGDFQLVIPGAQGPVTLINLAAWGWNPLARKFQWFNIGNATGGPVRALTVFDPVGFDPDGSGPEPAIADPGANWIVAGGDFTTIGGVPANRIAFFDETGAWNAIGGGITGANASVRALAVYDPPDPGSGRDASAGPPAVSRVADPADPPRMLFVGGVFDNAGNIASKNLAAWSGVLNIPGRNAAPGATQNLDAGDNEARIGRWNTPNFGTQPLVGGLPAAGHPDGPRPTWNTGPNVIDGAVNALVTFTAMPDYDQAGPIVQGDYLIVGGNFSRLGGAAGVGTAATRIAVFGPADPTQDSAQAGFSPRLLWRPPANGVAPAFEVFAMTTWDPVDNVSALQERTLVYGGTGGLELWAPTEGIVAPLGTPGGTVRALTAFVDQQEPQIPLTADAGGTDPQEILYVGGDFADIDGNAFNGVAGFGFDQNQQAFVFFSLGQGDGGGVGNADPNSATPAAVFALTSYDDGDPFRWDRHARPSARVSISINPDFAGFENTFVTIFDSNLNIIYTNDTIAAPFPDPSGSLDPRMSGPPAPNTQLIAPPMWGGEVYYLQVTGGGGTGRYNITITVDAVALDVTNPADQLPDELNGSRSVETREGRFAQSVRVFPALATGDTDLTIGAATAPAKFRSRRTFITAPTGAGNLAIQEFSDLGNISDIDDTDLWNFRAEFSGYVEIRIQTRGIVDQFGASVENLTTGDAVENDVDTPPGQAGDRISARGKTYNSPLDAALRIFSGDFEQMAYNDDNYAIPAGAALGLTGTLGQPVYYRRDSRVVIPVVAGNVYYIQVESGQRWVDGRPANLVERVHNVDREIDWRRVAGSYNLLVNAMPQLPTDLENGQTVRDDHPPMNTTLGTVNDIITNATPIAIGDDPDDPATNGRGSATGTINNTPNNPIDNDFFFFVTPGSGQLVITVSRTGGAANFTPAVTIFDENLNSLGDAAPNGVGSVRFTTTVTTGTRLLLRVIGAGGTEGDYRIDVSGVPRVDDMADMGKAWRARDIELLSFLGSGSATGRIEDKGDTDMFRFQALDYGTYTITVNKDGNSPTFNPFVTVYEVGEDPTGRAIFLRIATNDDISAQNNDARVTFSVSPTRRKDPQGGPSRIYPYYYVVVQGSNPFTDFGGYTVTVNFPPTDDHANAPLLADPNPNGLRNTSQFAFATVVTLDAQTGVGNRTGVIERAGDTDLFTFVSAASGTASVDVARATGSLLRQRVTVLADMASGQPSQTIVTTIAPDDAGISTVRLNFSVSRGTRYYVVVEGFDGGPNVNTNPTGAYSVTITAPPIDDYPNASEWDLASPITINNTTGIGQVGGDSFGDPLNARISPTGDSDLFSTVAIVNGFLTFTVTPLAASGGIAPRLSIYNASRQLIQQVSATSAGQERFITLSNVTAGTFFFILVENLGSVSGASPTGEYRLRVEGPTPGGGGGGGGGGGSNPGVIDFANPTVININPRNGIGERSDVIEVAGDRDLFTFNTPGFTGPGDTIIQVVTPEGSLLDATVRLLQNPNEGNDPNLANNGFDADGIPGATAQYKFSALPNHQYWIIVSGVGQATGSYTVRVSTRPAGNALYFPEGFANNKIDSYIALSNPNASATAGYTVYLRYETGESETVLASGTLLAGLSTRITVSSPSGRPTGVLDNKPFSIIIQSDVAMAASYSHTDFGGSLGESFTTIVSPTWNFARVEKNSGGVLDFVLFYNPHNFPVIVTMTAFQTGRAAVSDTRLVQGLRRGGWSINDVTTIGQGIMSVVVTARAADSAFDSQFEGVVASLSHYDLVNPAAFAVLGDQGATTQVITSFTQGSTVNSEIVLFNPGTSTATVSITGSYVRAVLPGITRLLDIQPRQRVVLAGSSLGLVADQPIGLRISSSLPISVAADQRQRGELDATGPADTAGTRFLLGSTRLNLASLGNLFFSTLNLYNPATIATTITIKLNFTDGTSTSTTVNLAARSFGELQLHNRADLFTGRSGTVEFAMDATALTPFVLTNTYHDLSGRVGWTSGAQAFGLTNSISRI